MCSCFEVHRQILSYFGSDTSYILKFKSHQQILLALQVTCIHRKDKKKWDK